MKRCVRCGVSDGGHPGSSIFTGCPGFVAPAPLWMRMLARILGGRRG